MMVRTDSRLLFRGLALVGLCLLASGVLVPGLSRAAEQAERWQATSLTAISVTGNVTFAPDRIQFENGPSLSLAIIGPVSGFKAMGETVDATVFRVTAPADPGLKNGNRLCGSQSRTLPVTYIAIWNPEALPGDKSPRSMAAFSGTDPPNSSGSPDSCGIYTYDSDH